MYENCPRDKCESLHLKLLLSRAAAPSQINEDSICRALAAVLHKNDVRLEACRIKCLAVPFTIVRISYFMLQVESKHQLSATRVRKGSDSVHPTGDRDRT